MENRPAGFRSGPRITRDRNDPPCRRIIQADERACNDTSLQWFFDRCRRGDPLRVSRLWCGRVDRADCRAIATGEKCVGCIRCFRHGPVQYSCRQDRPTHSVPFAGGSGLSGRRVVRWRGGRRSCARDRRRTRSSRRRGHREVIPQPCAGSRRDGRCTQLDVPPQASQWRCGGGRGPRTGPIRSGQPSAVAQLSERSGSECNCWHRPFSHGHPRPRRKKGARVN